MKIIFAVSKYRKESTKSNFDYGLSDYSESLLESMFKKWRD